MQDAGLLASPARPDVAETAGQHVVHATGQVLLPSTGQQSDAGGCEGGHPLGVVLEHAEALGQPQQDERDARQGGFVQGFEGRDRQLAFVAKVVAVGADIVPGRMEVVGERRVVDDEGRLGCWHAGTYCQIRYLPDRYVARSGYLAGSVHPMS